jgi:HD-GYP domain-containing protein (c-di-GMP phosphodiesterase class II)
MELKETSVEDLRFGMYVSKLDRPWTETPFVFQGFILKSDKQLEVLKKYCKAVFVDPEKAEVEEAEKVTAEDIAKIRGTTVYREMASVEAELPRAVSAYKNSVAVVKELSRAIEIGKNIDASQAKEAAYQITDSVARNPDAMALLVKLQEQSGATLSRAVEISVTMTIFGRFLQFPHDRLEILGIMGLLQDVGKLKMPPEIAKRGPINAREAELYKLHLEASVEILTQTPGIQSEVPGLVSLHHERYDGSGYPRGLKGPSIALFGQIAGMVDAYDTLTAPPPFGERMTPANALNVLYKLRGRQFQAAMVEQFIQCIGVYPVGSIVEMNTGEKGVVYAQNLVRRLQPRVMIVQDPSGNPVLPYKLLDLMKEPKANANEHYKILRTLGYDSVKIDPREFFL